MVSLYYDNLSSDRHSFRKDDALDEIILLEKKFFIE